MRKKLQWKLLLSVMTGMVVLGAILFSWSHGVFSLSNRNIASAPFIQPVERFEHIVFKKNSTLFQELMNKGISTSDILLFTQSLKGFFSVSRVQPGMELTLYYTPAPVEALSRIEIGLSIVQTLIATRNYLEDKFHVVIEDHPTQIRVETYQGIVESSLWVSADKAGMDPSLIASLAEIFAWQVDFNRDVRVGDRWRLSVERHYLGDKNVAWGNILSAEYQNAEEGYTAIRFEAEEGRASYFMPDGRSLRRMFLKSPMRFGRISSGFQKSRFHPILKVRRPHLGVDYAAPTGTPILTVGDGTVQFVGRKGGGGKTVVIRHNSVYKTAYKHMSRYAKGMRSGKKVKQGEVIGYVGSTGLATGPHLHFEFYENGRYMDPLRMDFPSSDPVPSQLMGDFEKEVHEKLALLPAWSLAESFAYLENEK